MRFEGEAAQCGREGPTLKLGKPRLQATAATSRAGRQFERPFFLRFTPEHGFTMHRFINDEYRVDSVLITWVWGVPPTPSPGGGWRVPPP